MIWVVVGILLIAVMAGALSLPVWKQNRYNDLIRTQIELKKELSQTRQNLYEVRLKYNELASRKNVGAFAEEVLSMGIYRVPLSAEVNGE